MAEERLQKVMAAAGVASRRHAEDLIRAGRVRVNGLVVTELGTRVDIERDRIEVDGNPLSPETRVYLALNKPDGVVTTADDELDRQTVLDLIPKSMGRVYPVGRLDMDSKGLVLLTNDGQVAHKLTHPQFEHDKEYRVRVAGQPSEGVLDQLREGIELEDGPTAPAEITILERKRDATWLRMILREGRKRQIRRMFDAIEHPVRELVRVRIGPIQLGDLSTGTWRRLNSREVSALRRVAAGKQVDPVEPPHTPARAGEQGSGEAGEQGGRGAGNRRRMGAAVAVTQGARGAAARGSRVAGEQRGRGAESRRAGEKANKGASGQRKEERQARGEAPGRRASDPPRRERTRRQGDAFEDVTRRTTGTRPPRRDGEAEAPSAFRDEDRWQPRRRGWKEGEPPPRPARKPKTEVEDAPEDRPRRAKVDKRTLPPRPDVPSDRRTGAPRAEGGKRTATRRDERNPRAHTAGAPDRRPRPSADRAQDPPHGRSAGANRTSSGPRRPPAAPSSRSGGQGNRPKPGPGRSSAPRSKGPSPRKGPR